MNASVLFLVRAAGVALLYAAAANAGLAFAVVGSTVTLVWAASGIALAALLLYGYQMAWGVALGAFIANALTDVPLGVAVGVSLGNTLEALVGTFLLLHFAGFHNALHRRRDVFALIVLCAVGSTTVSAIVGVSTLVLGGTVVWVDLPAVALKWWLGDMMGVLVVTPPLLVWLRQARPAMAARAVLEAVCLGATLLFFSYAIFGAPELAGRGYYPASLALFPFVIWGALRFGQRGATLVTLAVSVVAIWGTTRGTGPFVVEQPVDSLVRWCTFAIVLAVTGLLLAASVAEQRRAQADLQRSHHELERQVNDRTHDLTEANTGLVLAITERRHLETELIRVSEVQQQKMGRELHDGLGQHLTSLALMGATLQQKLAALAQPEAEAAGRITELANEANAMTRSLGRGLYPVALEFGGLAAALERLAAQTRSTTGIACEFHCGADVQVQDSMVAINLYRVAQEAINNAVKYSQARQLRIELVRDKHTCRLTVSDDGIGMDNAPTPGAEGLGMHSMRYRASLLGGSFGIERNVQGGTSIVVTYSETGREV